MNNFPRGTVEPNMLPRNSDRLFQATIPRAISIVTRKPFSR
jgi:hypothetical protein